MKIQLTEDDINFLFRDTNCVVIPEWEGGPATINKTDDGKFYMVRWEEYEPCTDLVDISDLVDVSLSEGVLLHKDDYSMLYDHWFRTN